MAAVKEEWQRMFRESGGTMSRIVTSVLGAAIILNVWSLTMAIGTAVAQVPEIEPREIPRDTVVRGDPLSIHFLDKFDIPADMVGIRCSVHSTSENQRSVHSETNLIVTSGGSSVTLLDVEREGGDRTDADRFLTLGTTANPTAKIEVQLGPDGVFSGGFVVSFCEKRVVCRNPALTVGADPTDQDVAFGGDANFDVTLTNTGDEPFFNVDVDSSVGACDHTVDALPVGQQSSYSCTAAGVTGDLDVKLQATATGQDPSCVATGSAQMHVMVAKVCPRNPALTIAVVPSNQDVPVDGNATFDVTVTNSGDEDLVDIAVESSVDACDNDIEELTVGESASYTCKTGPPETIVGGLDVRFRVTGVGRSCSAEVDSEARAIVKSPCVPHLTNPRIAITVTPEKQTLSEQGKDAEFAVTVTNSGDEDLVNIAVESSVDACDNDIEDLAVGESASYTCNTGEFWSGVKDSGEVEFRVTGAVPGVGETCPVRPESDPPAVVAWSAVPPPSLQPPTSPTITTTTPPPPTGVPAGVGDDATPRVPIGALAMVGLGITAVAAATYRITRGEE
jgi:hypothetical protein